MTVSVIIIIIHWKLICSKSKTIYHKQPLLLTQIFVNHHHNCFTFFSWYTYLNLHITSRIISSMHFYYLFIFKKKIHILYWIDALTQTTVIHRRLNCVCIFINIIIKTMESDFNNCMIWKCAFFFIQNFYTCFHITMKFSYIFNKKFKILNL